jgi:biotin carboxyl carrier protein
VSVTRLQIAAGGREHAVTIEPDGSGRYRIAIDGGEAVVVDAAAVDQGDATAWSLRDPATGLVSAVAVTLTATGDGDAVVGGHRIPVAIVDRRRRGRGGLGVADGEQRVVAPMPGKVIKVLVRPGDTVAPRQGLVVVEAMKMENELTAQKAGTVTEVAVKEGCSVEAGRLLVVVA